MLKVDLKDHQGALEDYTQGIELDPNHAYALLQSEGYTQLAARESMKGR